VQSSVLVSAVMLLAGLAPGTAEAAVPDAPPLPAHTQLQTVRAPSMPSVSLEASAELLAAKQRELANRILGGLGRNAEPSAAADVSPQSSAPVGEPAVPVHSDAPQAADQRPPPERVSAPVRDAAGLDPPAPAALAQPSPGEPSAYEVRDASGGAAQEPEPVASPRPGPGRRAAAPRFQPAAVETPPDTARSPSNSTSNYRHAPAPVPPQAPHGAFSAGPGFSSSLLLGGVVAALLGLMLRQASRAPTGRAATPSARLAAAPFLARPERPG
jgi:hypothetical protein